RTTPASRSRGSRRTPTATSCSKPRRRRSTASSTRSSTHATSPTTQALSGQADRATGGAFVAKFGDGGELLKCSFCGKSQKQVKKLIAGRGVYICDECIDLFNAITEEELSETTELRFDELPKPKEIFDFLDDYIIGQE